MSEDSTCMRLTISGDTVGNIQLRFYFGILSRHAQGGVIHQTDMTGAQGAQPILTCTGHKP